ncbi:TPR repeat region-containing protein [Mycolicibacterium brisbanense]|uniref:TPR repeat region-containing protein n=1 Tax=Mycolicibacterium brisbanense TaxID=146020 RepID=UPI000A3F3DE8|nr:EspA/EspE family type VII secretion system effector [Mycolicibacterium brisbanense]MCV7160539.1 hypothetical protein [Mycolicibacterium brisbanense]
MGLLDAFNETWSQARETFGQGTPEDGSKFDGSSRLLQMKSSVEAAAPDSRWQGTASDAYAAANKEHAQVYGKLADLDKRMAAEVTNAANVVTTGRQNLDNVKSWVTSMAATIPDTDADERDRKLLPIVNKGVSQLSDIIQKSTNDMTDIRGRVQGIKGEYDALTNQKFAPGEKGPGEKDGKDEKKGDLHTLTGDGREKDVHKQAEQDVHDALAGNKDAAARVENVLKGIHPGQSLSEKEGAYLSQMQAQQKGMSVERLKEVREKLGEHGDIIPNSWQLMSNKDVQFPVTKPEREALDDPSNVTSGGGDKLPDKVRSALESSGVLYTDQTRDIANIVKSGDESLQKGTELDRALINKADKMMDAPIWEKDPVSNGKDGGRDPYLDPAVSDVFSAVSRDHEVVHDHLISDKGQDFLHDVTRHAWADNGQAAGSLFEWTKDSTGSEGRLAAETAETYGKYLGVNGEKLLDLPGHHSIGETNPKLVQAFAHGLAPYQEAMVGERNGNGFDPLDGLGTNLDNTRKLFAVIDSNPDAAKYFNGEAYKHVVDYQNGFAEAAKADPTVPGTNPHQGDLAKAGRLLGLIDAGAYIATDNHNENVQQSAYDHAKAAWDLKKLGWDVVGENIPGIDRLHAALEQGMIGSQPDSKDFPEGTTTTDVGVDNDRRELGNGATQAAYSVAAGLVNGPNNDISSTYFNGTTLMTPAEVRAQYGEAGWEDYRSQLSRYFANNYPSLGSAVSDFQWQYSAPNTNLPKREQ